MEFGGGFPLSPLGEVASGNITSAPSGIPYYTRRTLYRNDAHGDGAIAGSCNYMPWKMCGKQTDEDLKAMFACLRHCRPLIIGLTTAFHPPTAALRRHGAGNQNRPVS